MQRLSPFERRFIPAAEFDADMGRMPVDDSGVVPVAFSDAEELRRWQEEQNAFFDERAAEFDEAFGAVEVQRVEVRQAPTLPAEVAGAKAEVIAVDALIEMLHARRDAAQAVVCRFEASQIMLAAERGDYSGITAA